MVQFIPHSSSQWCVKPLSKHGRLRRDQHRRTTIAVHHLHPSVRRHFRSIFVRFLDNGFSQPSLSFVLFRVTSLDLCWKWPNIFQKSWIPVQFQPTAFYGSSPHAVLLRCRVVVSMCLHSDCVFVLLFPCCASVAGQQALLFLRFPVLLGPCNAVKAHLIVSSIATNDMCHQTSPALHSWTHTHFKYIVVWTVRRWYP